MRDPRTPPAPFRPPPRPPLAAFAAGFRYAWDGLVESALHCRNMRVHLVLGVLAAGFASLAPLGAAERAIVLLFVALVPAAEAANTALEAVVDLASPAWSPAARAAKDAAAGAVLLLAVGSVTAFVAIASPVVPAMWAARAALAPAVACVAGAAAAATALVFAGRKPAAVDGLATAAGAVLLAVLALRANAAGAIAACALLAVAAGAAARRRRLARRDA